MQRIGTEGSHGSNLVWRPLKAAAATLRALPFNHSFFSPLAVERIIPSTYTTLTYPSITHRGWISNPPICILKWMSANNGRQCSFTGLMFLVHMWECSLISFISIFWGCEQLLIKAACQILIKNTVLVLQHYWHTECLGFTQIAIKQQIEL